MHKNLFIALEGIDGSGKSTQAKLLAKKLEESGEQTYLTFEPTDNFVGSIIRNILRGKMKADERTIAGLFVADRLDHLQNESYGILKKLEEGSTVITDRYYFSSYAYNGLEGDMDWVISANAMSANLLRPDATIFIDISPELAMQRVLQNREVTELYETLDNLKNVRRRYLEAFEKLKHEERIIWINGNQSMEQVTEDILKAVAGLRQ